MTSRLTDLQLRFWADRGYLIIKGAYSSHDLSELGLLLEEGSHGAEARRRLGSMLDSRLHPLAMLLVGEDVVTLDVVRAGPGSASLHLDAWDGVSSDDRCVSFLVALTSIGGDDAPLFYPGSHAPGEQGHLAERRADFARLATRLRSEELKPVGLTCAPGDIWIRHPRLLHGSMLAGAEEWTGLAVRCCGASAVPQDPAAAEVTGPL